MAKAAAKKAPAKKAAPAVAPPLPAGAGAGKQAVVVVHGIGEQRPLDTLREFVETAFQRDPTLTPDDAGDPRYAEMVDGFKLNRVWIVPDVTTGSNELRRITTTEHFGNRRTDFYEYYWADLTNGTPLEMVRAWVMGLLIRSPWRIPNDGRVWWAWIILWVLSLTLVAFALLIAYPVGPFETAMAAFGAWLDQSRSWVTIVLVALGVVLLVVRAYRTKPIKLLKLKGPLALFLLGAIIYFVPTEVLTSARLWAAVGAAIVGYITGTVLVPYIGDIVQYVRATPATVAAREAIRSRGVELLRRVIDKKYDRIILVGHSLGCFVAYDMLQLIWQERGPSPKNQWEMSAELEAALHAVDRHVQAFNPLDPGKEPVFVAANYAADQQRLRAALAASAPRNWVISDFVTLGSPIAHSAFLTHDDGDAVEAGLAERMLSASPPRPDDPNNSMFFASDDERHPWPHHAAVFAAVRWTNIFDHAPFPAFGDVVSGEIDKGQFGPGVRNERVAIERGTLPLWSRRFTHTEYWRLTNGSWQAPDDHVKKLREALNLRGE